MSNPAWSLVVHGGSGVIDRADLTPEQDAAYRRGLGQAALDGAAVLKVGGSALDAVETAVRALENDPLFNAGRGAVFTAEGRNELDAAIMDGTGLAAGAVAGVTRTRIHADMGDPDRAEKRGALVPLGRPAEPEEIAAAIAWLLSDEASFTTGAVLRVAGGN